jgi:hypothetical membrane protein
MSKKGIPKNEGRSNTLPSSVTRLYWIAIIGVILYVILDALAQSLPPHYSPIRDAESDLAVGPYGFIMTVNFLIRGILTLVFLLAFVKSVDLSGSSRAPFKGGFFLLCLWAVGAILLALFPTDVPSTPMSWHGAIHFIIAIIAFIGGAFGTLGLSIRFGESVAFGGAKRLATTLAYLAVLFWAVEFLVPFVAPHLVARFGGLFERLFLGSVLLWILGVSWYMVTRKSQVKTLPQTGQ